MKIEKGFRHAHSTLAGSIELPAHEHVDHCMERPRLADSIESIIGKNGNDLSSSPFSQHDLKSFSLRFDELNEVHEEPDETPGQTPAKSTPGAKKKPGSKNLLNWFSVSGAQMAFEIRKQGAQTNLQTEVGTSTSAKPEAQTNLQTQVGTNTPATPKAQTNLQTEVGTNISVDPTETANMDQKVETKVDTNKTVETEATNMDQKVDTEVGTNTPATPKAQTNLQTEVGTNISVETPPKPPTWTRRWRPKLTPTRQWRPKPPTWIRRWIPKLTPTRRLKWATQPMTVRIFLVMTMVSLTSQPSRKIPTW